MSTEPVEIIYTISIGLANASRKGNMKIDREEWDGLTPDERIKYVDEMYETEIANVMDGGWSVVNADIDDPTVED